MREELLSARDSLYTSTTPLPMGYPASTIESFLDLAHSSQVAVSPGMTPIRIRQLLDLLRTYQCDGLRNQFIGVLLGTAASGPLRTLTVASEVRDVGIAVRCLRLLDERELSRAKMGDLATFKATLRTLNPSWERVMLSLLLVEESGRSVIRKDWTTIADQFEAGLRFKDLYGKDTAEKRGAVSDLADGGATRKRQRG